MCLGHHLITISHPFSPHPSHTPSSSLPPASIIIIIIIIVITKKIGEKSEIKTESVKGWILTPLFLVATCQHHHCHPWKCVFIFCNESLNSLFHGSWWISPPHFHIHSCSRKWVTGEGQKEIEGTGPDPFQTLVSPPIIWYQYSDISISDNMILIPMIFSKYLDQILISKDLNNQAEGNRGDGARSLPDTSFSSYHLVSIFRNIDIRYIDNDTNDFVQLFGSDIDI